jgi:Cd2+/Zn2+-exporting ATPase
LEAAARVKVVAFDKTGTLTTGRPGVVAIIPVGLTDERRKTKDESIAASFVLRPSSFVPADDQLGELTAAQVQLFALAAAIERFSEHPLARAIVKGVEEREIAIPEADDFEALTGAGAHATVLGRRMRIGRPTLFGQLTPDVAIEVHAQETQGRTVVLLGDDTPWGLIAIADTVRPEAAAAVARLKATGIERVVLLTGDNATVANRLAAALGVDEVRAELLPSQKVAAIKDLQARYGPVAMVGDGVNDAPALATAALGVAMGVAGTDVALESADVLLMGDDLGRLPGALDLARRARRIIRQNLIFAFTVMVALMLLAIAGDVALPLGVVGHEGSTLLVCLNGIRLLKRSW